MIIRLVENWPVKMLSIALALILFIFNRLTTQTTHTLLVPLAIETHSMLVPASTYPRNVRIRLRGDDEGLKNIVANDLEAYVDLMKQESGGSYNVSVQIRRKGAALGIEPLEISVTPSKIAIQLDRKTNRIIPLSVAIRGRVADGYDLVSHTIAPSEQIVSGPHDLLESISELKTEPIELEGRNSDFTVVTNIANPNPLFIIQGNGTAEVSGIIRPSVLVQTIEGIPITLLGLDPRFEADTGGRTGTIRIEGRQSQLDAFQSSPGFFTVDCSGILTPGSYTLPVMVDLPKDFSLIRREPENLVLTVSLKNPALSGD